MTHRTDPNPSERIRKHARDLRRNSTEPERLLWGRLRSRRLMGFKFRRQVPIDQYILDFYCERLRLAIEVDGESHVGRGENDAFRTARLQEHDTTVIRITNDDVLRNIDDVLEYIASVAVRLDEALTPSPSPKGRGE